MASIGMKSFWELGSAFVNTMYGYDVFPTPNVYTCSRLGSDGRTMEPAFFLNMNLFTSNDSGQQHECDGSDWIILFVLTSMIFCVTWLARFCIWRPLYDSMMKEKNPKISSHWSQDNRNKFGETLTSATYFICSAMFVYNLLYPKAWLWEPKSWSQDIYPHVTIDADYKFFYLLYASRFIADFLLIFMEDRKWDAFTAAFIHHVATIGLVLCSAHFGFHRIGGAIMFFFDWADIPLLIAKTFKYLSKDPKDIYQYVANQLFTIFAITFFMTRGVLFNSVVYVAYRDFWNYNSATKACCIMLTCLVGLQSYWMVLIVITAMKQAQNGGVVEDLRDSKDEDMKKPVVTGSSLSSSATLTSKKD